MKQLVLAIVLATALFNQTYAQERLEWSEKQKLTVNDFKGPTPDPSTKQTLIFNLGTETSLSNADIGNLKTFNGQVANVFSPTRSWIDWTVKSKLTYANTLFDLNEWKVREIRRRLNESRELVLAGDYQWILEAVDKEFEQIQLQYDGESDYGNNPIGQLKWESRIHERLQALADYCKGCGSGKE